jgi:RimJ/RimL family protein N-acetyltransferase
MVQFEHYILRLLAMEDLETYFEMMSRNRDRLLQYFAGTVSKTKNLDDTKEFLIDMENRVNDRSYFPYVLVDNVTGSFIGFYDLKNIEWSVPKTEIGYFIDLEYTGKGIGAKALKVFCDHCFLEYGFEKLFLRTHESNFPARRIAEKSGFEIEGKLRKDYKTSSGDLVDVLYYGLIR